MEHPLLKDLALIVISSTISTWIFSRLKLPALLGFISVGILLSPVFGLLHETQTINELGELGVLFMMFFVGIEFNPDKIKKVFAPSLFGIIFQIAAMGILGIAAARAMGLNRMNGLFLGGVLTMSSTVVFMEIFGARGLLSKKFAQIAVGILVLEDIFAIFLLVVLSGIARTSRIDLGGIWETVLLILTFVITIYVVGKFLANSLSKKFAKSKSQQTIIMFAMCAMLGIGEIAVSSGMSLALGAFLAGSVLSGTQIAAKAERLTAPFRNLFIAIFFVSVGTMIEPQLIARLWLPIILISAAVAILKTLACYCGILLGGASGKDAFLAAANKAQVGEFGFVIAALGISMGVMDSSVLALAMGVSFLTVFLNPIISRNAEGFCDFAARHTPEKILLALKIYKNSAAALSENIDKKPLLSAIYAPLLRTIIYAFLFNALLLLTVLVYGKLMAAQVFESDARYMSVWILSGILTMPIMFGLLRNLEDVIMKIIMQGKEKSGVRKALAAVLKIVANTATLLFFAAIYFTVLEQYFPSSEVGYLYIAEFLVLAALFGRGVVKLNQGVEIKFAEVFKRHLENAESHKKEVMLGRLKSRYSWAHEIAEVDIPENSAAIGKTLRELNIRSQFGCDIVAIRRGDFVIYKVMPETYVSANDQIILSGSSGENESAKKFLETEDFSPAKKASEIYIERVEISGKSAMRGKTLADLKITKYYAARVVAIVRAGQENPSRPSPFEPLGERDSLTLLGDFEEIQRLKADYSLAKI
ncbi:MAG: cation:proton antiporter [Opitutales bacterium]|nr:cation:proton antiporter [Opitutales bacterium]